MKSRRRIAFPKAWDHADRFRLQQGFATGEMGLGVSLHGSNLKPLMSALGQKQACALQQLMSALHPIATAKADMKFAACPVYPQERTCAAQLTMSAKGQ
jgi:hypothetical protein